MTKNIAVEIRWIHKKGTSALATTLTVSAGTSIADCLQHIGISISPHHLEQTTATTHAYAISSHGKKLLPHTVLNSNQQITLTPPLLANPKTLRRQRAQTQQRFNHKNKTSLQ